MNVLIIAGVDFCFIIQQDVSGNKKICDVMLSHPIVFLLIRYLFVFVLFLQ